MELRFTRWEFIIAAGIGTMALAYAVPLVASYAAQTIAKPLFMQPAPSADQRLIPPFMPPIIDRQKLTGYPLTPVEIKLLQLIPPSVERPLIVLGPLIGPDSNGRLSGLHIFVPAPARMADAYIYLAAISGDEVIDKWAQRWTDTLQLARSTVGREVDVVGKLNGSGKDVRATALLTSSELITDHLTEKFGKPDVVSGYHVPHAKYDSDTGAASLEWRYVQPQEIKKMVDAGNALAILYARELLNQGVDITNAKISLFGSAAQGRAVPGFSDIDVAFEFDNAEAFMRAITEIDAVPRKPFYDILRGVYKDILGISNPRDIPTGQHITLMLRQAGGKIVDIFVQAIKP